MKFPALSQLLLVALATSMLTGRVITGTEPHRVDGEIRSDTNQITNLTPDQARTLVSQHRQRILQLNGLIELTPPVAVHLKTFGGDHIELNGVADLSATVASHLSEFKGSRIDMNGLRTLTPHAADEIARFDGHLSFRGLNTLSPETASNLRAFNVHPRSSADMVFIPLEPEADVDVDALFEKAFLAMRDNPRAQLSLNGLSELSPKVAEYLADYSGSKLELDGLRAISPEAAKALADFRGKELSLRGLTTLPDDVAKPLAQTKGKLMLDGVTTLSDEAARNLRANPGIVLPAKFAPEKNRPRPEQREGSKAEPSDGAESR